MQPFNYITAVQDPVSRAIEGYQQGLGAVQGRQQLAAGAQAMETDLERLALQTRQVDQADRRIDIAEQQFGAQQAQYAAQVQAQQAAAARMAEMQADFTALASNETANSQDYTRLMLKYPEVADEVKATFEVFSEERKGNELRTMGQMYAAIKGGNIEIARDMMTDRMEAARNSGEDQEADLFKANLAMLDAAPEAVLMQLGMGIKAMDEDGRYDGLLDGGNGPVRASKILADGTTITVRDTGTEVRGKDGALLEGEAAAKAIQMANDEEVRLTGANSGAREGEKLNAQIELGGEAKAVEALATQAVDLAGKGWESYGKIQQSIGSIDTAIQAIDDGARTGAVEKYFVNITEASATLQNAMDRMGLDVIGSVTFGALSEGELRLAMETAVPRNLDETQLRSWLVKRKDAQQKAAAMVLDAAQFLSDPKNTLNDWISKNKAEKRNPPPADGPLLGGAIDDLELQIDELLKAAGADALGGEVER